MSNLTVGKIVNNSATLVLNSTDQDGFGEKIVTGSNFTKKDGTTTPAGTYQVISDNFYAKQPYNETFFQLQYGIRDDRPVVSNYDDFVEGKYYAIKTKGAGDLNKAGNVGTTSSFVNDGSNNPILDMTDGQLGAEPIAKLYYKCLNQPPSGVANTWGEAVLVEELPSGSIFQPADNAELDSDFPGTAYALSSVDYNNVDYRISIPNEASFPGKSRCLVKVESIAAGDVTSYDTVAYVDIPEMAPHNLFIKGRRAIGAVSDQGGMNNTSSLLDSGVLCQTPFGKTLSVKLFDVANHDLLGSNLIHSNAATVNLVNKFPTTIVIQLLFLTNEDLKDF